MARGGSAFFVAGALSACGFELVPEPDPEPSCFVYVVASDSHSCARKTAGTLFCWGNNQHGQLGTGDSETRPTPQSVDEQGLESEVTGVYVPTGSGSISTRTAFTCARKADGTLWCWGNNEYGQLGTGDTERRLSPVQVDPEGLGTGVHAAALGSGFACARKNDNSIWCWGANESGQLGTNDRMPRLKPVQIDPAGLGNSVRYLSTGSSHTCARKIDGTLWCWGDNQYGQLGTGDTEPRLMPAQVDRVGLLSRNVDVIAAGAFHTCATKTDGTIWCWGNNQYGQLGVGTGPRYLPEPLDFPDLAGGVPLVSAGGEHTCAAKVDGTLWCWGSNRAGQLGRGGMANSFLPVQVDQSRFLAQVAVVYAGGAHTCTRNIDASLWCWGSNEYTQLGIGADPTSSVPVQVAPACP